MVKLELSRLVADELYYAVQYMPGPIFDLRLAGDRFVLGGIEPGGTFKPAPSAVAWKCFWVNVEKSRMWTWSPTYENPDIYDGVASEVSLRYQGKVVRSQCINAFPGTAQRPMEYTPEYLGFLKALRTLAGIHGGYI